MYLCDNDTNLIVMEHVEEAITARDFINTALQVKTAIMVMEQESYHRQGLHQHCTPGKDCYYGDGARELSLPGTSSTLHSR